jgi:hypothetical protein
MSENDVDNEIQREVAELAEDWNETLYNYPRTDNVEKTELYQPGWDNPIDIGDSIGLEDRYPIITNSVGDGMRPFGCLTVSRYLAIKIVMSSTLNDAVDIDLKV